MPPARPSRKSVRTSSSPFVGSSNANSPAPQKEKEKGQSSLDRWIEPPLKDPVPSFEDHGFERQGVVSHMQALGALPTARDKTRSRADGLRRSAAGKNGFLSAGDDARDTPDTVLSVEAAQQPDERTTLDFLPQIPANRDEEEDDDYMPANKKKKGKKSRTPKHSATSETPLPQGIHPSRPDADTSASPPREETGINGVGIGVEKAVRGAVARAETGGQVRIGTVLQRLYQESKHDEELADLLSFVAKHSGRTPTKEQQTIFDRYVKRAKKFVAMDQAEGTGERSPKRTRTSRSSAGFASLSPTQSATQSLSPSIDKTTKIKTTSSAQATPTPEQPLAERTVTPLKETTTNTVNSRANGMSSSALPSQRSRTGSVSSISSLSSVDESIAAGPPPDILDEPTVAKSSTSEDAINGASDLSAWPRKPIAKRASSSAAKRSPDEAGLTESEDEEIKAKRQKYAETLPSIAKFNSAIKTSGIRDQPAGSRLPIINEPPVLGPPRRQTLKLTNGLYKRSALQANGSGASPLSEVFPPPGSGPVTRATTPNLNADGGERPAKRQKTSARTKHSPIKNRSGGVAGVARASGGMDSPIGYGEDNDARSDNDDFCSACGFSGLLLCCDGCDKAFHLTCCDPPLEVTPSERWLCHSCIYKSNPSRTEPFSLFSPLAGLMNKRNPTVFALPKPVQDHFEGVRADAEGAYEEVHATKPLNKGRGGWDEVPDNTKLKDAKGNAILCIHCGKSSLNKQQIIQCDVCNANWHLECLDPPMANPPPIPFNAKHRNIWTCPLHTDRDLRAIEPTVSNALGGKRIFRIRKPKHPTIVDVGMKRGFKNNGLIEVFDDSSESEKEFSEYDDNDEEGIVYRLPSQGIVLDFIHKVKANLRAKENERSRKIMAKGASRPMPAYDRKFSDASPVDRRASINLVQFANRESDLGLTGDALQTLIYSLNAESPDEVVAGMAEAETAASTCLQPPGEEERRQLVALQELIRRRLGASNGSV